MVAPPVSMIELSPVIEVLDLRLVVVGDNNETGKYGAKY